MNDAGAAKTRGRLHERRRSRGLNGASASASVGRHADVSSGVGSQRGRVAARLSAADARLVVQGGWHKEAAE
jgi:hypothetical protein